MGKGAFYNYFDSKHALVAELLSEAAELLKHHYLGRVNGVTSLDQRIDAIALQHETFFEDHPSYGLLFHQVRGLLQLRDPSAHRMDQVVSDYLSRLGKLILPPEPSSRWTEEDRMDVAAALAGALAGYRSYKLATGAPINSGTIRATRSPFT